MNGETVKCHEQCHTVDGFHVHYDDHDRRVSWSDDWPALLSAVRQGQAPSLSLATCGVGPFGWHDVVTVEEPPVECMGCGVTVDALDGWTDGSVVLCGELRGNGCCREMEGVTW